MEIQMKETCISTTYFSRREAPLLKAEGVFTSINFVVKRAVLW